MTQSAQEQDSMEKDLKEYSDEATEQEEVAAPTAETVEKDTATTDDGEAPEVLEPAEPTVEDELEKLAAERDEAKEQVLRARAEFDNYRKRMAREMERVRKTAAESLLLDCLPVVDNLERALSHVEGDTGGLSEGVEMVVKQFCDILATHGVEPIAALGEPFDPQVHEALSHQPSEEYAADVVMEEFARGYRLKDFVLRPTKVVVSSGPALAAATEEDAGDEEDAGA